MDSLPQAAHGDWVGWAGGVRTQAQWRKVHFTGRPSGTGERQAPGFGHREQAARACLLGLGGAPELEAGVEGIRG